MNKEEFTNELLKLGIELTEKQYNQLEKYQEILNIENNKYNLTTITEKREVFLKHFYDSLTIVNSTKLNNQYLLDIGTGAGFPGMVLKIVFPNLKVDLLDSTEKKCNFLKLIVETLELNNINIINARAEEYARDNREKYDIITSRAVAPLKHLLEYAAPMLKINGQFIALKSNIDEEIKNIKKYHNKLGLTNENIISFTLPIENSKRTLYKIEKIKPTPLIYPRSYSQIKKKEL